MQDFFACIIQIRYLDIDCPTRDEKYLKHLELCTFIKVDVIAYAIRKRQADVEFLKQEESRIKARRNAIENRIDSFKQYLASLLRKDGIKKIQGTRSTLYLQKSASVEVIDTNSLPTDLVETKIEFRPRKKDIKDRLNCGEAIPGAVIRHKQNLIVK